MSQSGKYSTCTHFVHCTVLCATSVCVCARACTNAHCPAAGSDFHNTEPSVASVPVRMLQLQQPWSLQAERPFFCGFQPSPSFGTLSPRTNGGLGSERGALEWVVQAKGTISRISRSRVEGRGSIPSSPQVERCYPNDRGGAPCAVRALCEKSAVFHHR